MLIRSYRLSSMSDVCLFVVDRSIIFGDNPIEQELETTKAKAQILTWDSEGEEAGRPEMGWCWLLARWCWRVRAWLRWQLSSYLNRYILKWNVDSNRSSSKNRMIRIDELVVFRLNRNKKKSEKLKSMLWCCGEISVGQTNVTLRHSTHQNRYRRLIWKQCFTLSACIWRHWNISPLSPLPHF